MAEILLRWRPALPPVPVPTHALRRALTALAVALLLMAGLVSLSTFWGPTQAWWQTGRGLGPGTLAGVQASLIAALATAAGALPIFVVRRLSRRHEAGMMAFSAGVMLAAAMFSLLLPSLDAARGWLGGAPWARWGAPAIAGLGLALGVAMMLGLDRLLPHEHPVQPQGLPLGGGRNAEASQRAWLMVLALVIHNIPEGLAVGAAYMGNSVGDGVSGGAGQAGPSVALAIALQNMPEGMIVAMALRSLGHGAGRAWAVAALSGLAEPLGAWLGVSVLAALPALYPVGLAVAAGAMLFVVSHEIIPDTHRNGFETLATACLIGGFAAMLLLGEALA